MAKKSNLKSKPASPAGVAHSIYNFSDYKEAIKAQVKYIRAKRPGLTMKELALRADIQHTYFSRCLNDDNTHLGEDQLFIIAHNLDLLQEDVDFLMILRSFATTQEQSRKQFLFKRIDDLRKRKIASAEHKDGQRDGNSESFVAEMKYLFNPLCVLIHVSLFIKSHQKNPRGLISKLGISNEQLRDTLQILDKNEYIELAAHDPYQVLKVHQKFPHFGREHPLMRAHQASLKAIAQSRLAQTPESLKESLLFTFTMDQPGFEKVRDEIKSLVRRIQETTFDSKQEHLYQLSLDFFNWL